MALSQDQINQLEKLNDSKFTHFICEICQDTFYTTKANTIYCGSACSSIAYRARIKERDRILQLKLANITHIDISEKKALNEEEEKPLAKLGFNPLDIILGRKK